MTAPSFPDPGPAPDLAPDLAQIISVPRDQPATIGGKVWDPKRLSRLRLSGLRLGRGLGLGLGGGLS